jgi:hypothetical protein
MKPKKPREQHKVPARIVNRHVEISEVTVRIQPGPASPAVRMAWRKFWSKLVSSAKDEVKREQ